VGDVLDEQAGGGSFGGVFGEEAGEEVGEVGLLLAGDDEFLGSAAVGGGVVGGAGFAGRTSRSCLWMGFGVGGLHASVSFRLSMRSEGEWATAVLVCKWWRGWGEIKKQCSVIKAVVRDQGSGVRGQPERGGEQSAFKQAGKLVRAACFWSRLATQESRKGEGKAFFAKRNGLECKVIGSGAVSCASSRPISSTLQM
jgi:hypothetical protein